MDDHSKNCYMRNTVCTCGYDNEREAAIAAKDAEIEKMKAVLIDVQYRLKNARGAVESNQVVDKDVHGTLTRAMNVVDAALKGDAE